jgi:ribosomal protein L14E/L6E/L27E
MDGAKKTKLCVYSFVCFFFGCENSDSSHKHLFARCSLKAGKIVILLHGKYAGRKAVIVKNHDEPSSGRPYGHAVVVGIDRYPLKVTKSMGPKKIAKRSRVKTFVKVVNHNHIMPTR